MTETVFDNDALPAKQFAQAAARHDFDGIRTLVNAGRNPDMRMPEFGTLLIYAVSQGQQGLAEHLLRAGADVNLADASGDTPLIHASRLGLQDIAESLLDAGADPLARNRAGESARDAALAASRGLSLEADVSFMSVDDIENSYSRLSRIAGRLQDAEEEAYRQKTVAACHDGLTTEMTVKKPLKLKFS